MNIWTKNGPVLEGKERKRGGGLRGKGDWGASGNDGGQFVEHAQRKRGKSESKKGGREG